MRKWIEKRLKRPSSETGIIIIMKSQSPFHDEALTGCNTSCQGGKCTRSTDLFHGLHQMFGTRERELLEQERVTRWWREREALSPANLKCAIYS
jgi:hypothetical protein